MAELGAPSPAAAGRAARASRPGYLQIPQGKGQQHSPALVVALCASYSAATWWLECVKKRDPIGGETASNCRITHKMHVQRVGREVRSLLQKKGVCIFFNSQGSSRINCLAKKMCVCVCDCMQETRNLTPCQPGAYSDIVPKKQEPQLPLQPLPSFVCLC